MRRWANPTAKTCAGPPIVAWVRTAQGHPRGVFQLMENQDYHKITIASVAREADIDRKTFYLHYRSVPAIWWTRSSATRPRRSSPAAARRCARMATKGLDVSKLFQSISLAPLAPDMTRSKRVLQHVSLQDVLDRLEGQALVDVLMEDNVARPAPRRPVRALHRVVFLRGPGGGVPPLAHRRFRDPA